MARGMELRMVSPDLRISAAEKEADAGEAALDEVQRTCGRFGEVQHAVFHEWAAVVHADAHRAAVVGILHSKAGAECERAVRGGELVRVEGLAARRAVAAKRRAVIRGDPFGNAVPLS